jgi:hypothetical protein
MYLCHFLTSVDSMKTFASRSHVPLLSTAAHFFQTGDSFLILILHLMRDLGWHRVTHHCSLLSLTPITFDANTILMLWWVLLCDYCSSLYHLTKTSEPSRAIKAHIIIAAYHRDHCLLFRVYSFAELSSAFIITAPEGTAVIYTNTSIIFCQNYITRAWGMPASFVHTCILLRTLWKVGFHRFLSSPKDCSTQSH